MTLIKLSEDHYIVVDESEIKEGDFVYSSDGGIFKRHIDNPCQTVFSISKITHSTQPIEEFNWMGNSEKGYDTIKPIPLSEVKELIGEINIEEKAWKYNPFMRVAYIKGYNQAIEDNKEKKYTEKAIRKAIEMARDIKDDSAHDIFTAEDISGCAEVCTYGWRNRYKDEEIIQSLQPKTEWDVEFIDGKLKLKNT